MNLFEPRTAFKPFEYPDAEAFKTAIQHSYWLHSEWNFQSDVQDFRTKLSEHERQIVRDSLLMISQVEVSVKRFWGQLGEYIPKPEIEQVGATFAESEVRHADAYSHLLQVLGLNQDFALFGEVQCVRRRSMQMSTLLGENLGGRSGFLYRLMYFSTFVENVSLFAQFAIVKSLNKHLAVLKDVDNVVQATQKEETIHAMFGHWLFNLAIMDLTDREQNHMRSALSERTANIFDAECDIVRWIFRDGDLSFLSADSVIEFLRQRYNESLAAVGVDAVFTVDQKRLEPLLWFDEEIHADTHSDFFHKRPVTYAKKTRSVRGSDLF